MQDNIEKRILENGMAVYFYVDKSKHSAQVDLITKVGGKYKDFSFDGKAYHYDDGMAHFIEHLLVEHSQYGNYLRLLETHHMNGNATTFSDRTKFYFWTTVDLKYGIEVLLNSVCIPAFTKEDIEQTKHAIYEEIRRAKDRIGRAMHETMKKNLYQNISYINNLGSLQNVEDITYEKVKTYYDAFYQPKNQFLIVSGNFEIEEIWEHIQKIISEIKYEDHKVELIDLKEPKEVKEKQEIIYRPTGETLIDITYKIDISNMKLEDRYKNHYYLLYFSKMNFGKASPLYQKLLDKNIIHNKISTGININDDFVEYTISGDTNYIEEFLSAVKDTLKNPTFDKELFDLYNNEEKMSLCCDYEFYPPLINNLINNIMNYGLERIDSIDDINELDFEEMKKVISNVDFSNYTIVILKDEGKK